MHGKLERLFLVISVVIRLFDLLHWALILYICEEKEKLGQVHELCIKWRIITFLTPFRLDKLCSNFNWALLVDNTYELKTNVCYLEFSDVFCRKFVDQFGIAAHMHTVSIIVKHKSYDLVCYLLSTNFEYFEEVDSGWIEDNFLYEKRVLDLLFTYLFTALVTLIINCLLIGISQLKFVVGRA